MTKKLPSTNPSTGKGIDRRVMLTSNAATAIASVGISGSVSAAHDADADLLCMYSEYKAALAERDAAEIESDCRMQAWDRVLELSDSIRCTPAKGPAGIAVKLALMGSLLDYEEFGKVRAAFEDAKRLAGIDIKPYAQRARYRNA